MMTCCKGGKSVVESRVLTNDAFIEGIQRSTTAQIVADKLAFMIASGLLSIGDALPSERDLGQMLGISRVTVRAAIQILAGQGLVEISQGARTRVISQPSSDMPTEILLTLNLATHDLRSVYAARRLIEREIINDVIHTLRPDTLERLRTLVAAQEEMYGDVAAFQISDREFHETIYRAGTNPVISEFALGLYAYGLGFRRRALSVDGAIARSHSDHRRIVESLAEGDPQNAALRADEHLANIYDTTSDAMGVPSGRRKR